MKRLFFSFVLALTTNTTFAQSSPGHQFMQTWDLDGNGMVTVEELRKMRGNVFKAFDTNQNDYLSADEYVAFDKARAGDVANYEAEQREQMQSIADGMSLENSDIDGDGRVERDEFLTGTVSWFNDLDKDDDDEVTLEDFAI
ncbi:EF-hand domain-containing protein [Vreelandella massiliensis]|uniref:EF-hand domain-containing protein n=1 Tax=Vreelandella massiliensis TaxID=1816686 RepID=UPI00096A66C3|nr:EF-hand domain-containing protein [Halomonas massiliensis]